MSDEERRAPVTETTQDSEASNIDINDHVKEKYQEQRKEGDVALQQYAQGLYFVQKYVLHFTCQVEV